MDSEQDEEETPGFWSLPVGQIESSIPAVAEKRLGINAGALVLEDNERAVTGGELDAWANALALTILNRLGDAPEPVAIAMSDPGIAIVAATLGVLKAGKIYTPLDRALAATERGGRIFRHCGARLIVTDTAHLAAAKQLAGDSAEVVNIDEAAQSAAPASPGIAMEPGRPACLLYTSGSTGSPKGVVYSHRAVLRNVLGQIDSHRLRPDDRMLLTASAGVVGGKRLSLSGILTGAAIIPFSIRDTGLHRLETFIEEKRITLIQTVPTVYRQFMAGLNDKRRLSTVRVMRLGGEPVLRGDFELFQRNFRESCEFANGMGSTESGTISVMIAGHDATFDEAILPAGRPERDVECLLRDKQGDVVAPGTEGELCVQSRFLPDGYWKSPDLTAEVFHQVPHKDGVREYRTGDLARIDDRGMITLVGRKDSQVKVRGFRVEPAEIEASLMNQAPIECAAVVPRTNAKGATGLIAYVQPKPGEAFDPDTARRLLEDALPPHMIPRTFIPIDTPPLTATGKIDRHALPAPPERGSVVSQGEAPRGEIEKAIAAIWREALGLHVHDRKDNFFELGGDSINAAGLCQALHQEFGIELTPVDLVETPELNRLAARIRDHRSRIDGAVPLNLAGSQDPLFLFPQAGGDGFIYRDLAKALDADRPIYAMSPPGLNSESTFDETVETIAARHVSTIESIQPEGRLRLGGISFGGVLAWEATRQLLERGRSVAFLGLFDSYSPEYRSFHFPRSLPYEWAQKLRLHRAALARLSLRGKWRYLGERTWNRLLTGRKFGEPGRNRREETLFEKIYQRDLDAMGSYKPERLDVRITLFRCAIHFQKELGRSRDYGWSRYCGENLTIVDVPGYHTTIFAPPFVQESAAKLEPFLTGADEPSDSLS